VRRPRDRPDIFYYRRLRFVDDLNRLPGITRKRVSRMAVMFAKQISNTAHFFPDKMGKSTVMRGEFLFVGLNAFEPGQEHAPHVHEGQDKVYFILEGSGVVRVGEETELLLAGDAAYAPSGVPHSIRNPGPARLVTMVVLAPPPPK
jgi:mannose-6-phosphate isomerase-like protein (cupin superfamily)